MKRIIAAILAAGLALPAAAAPARRPASQPGVKHTFFRIQDRGALNAHLVTIDLDNPSVKLQLGLAANRVNKAESVWRIAQRNNAAVAINASFFQARGGQTTAVGLTMVDGQVIYDSKHRRTAVGFTPGNGVIMGVPKVATVVAFPELGRTLRLDGVNRSRRNDETILYTAHHGPYTHTNKYGREALIQHGRIVRWSYGNTRVPQNGTVLSFQGVDSTIARQFPVGTRVEVETLKTGAWRDVNTIITAGPQLINKGRVSVSVVRDRFRGDVRGPAARSAIGITRHHKLLLLTVNPTGKNGGITFTKLAQTLKRLGAVEAMGLDGGGSSTLYLSGKVVNKGAFSYLRPVSNALLVLFRH
jgi:exopolysaccharide biosynthesis protein